jgi:hypothetical protein
LGLDPTCQGNAPTITVYGKTFELDAFDLGTEGGWYLYGQVDPDNYLAPRCLIQGKVKLGGAGLPRYSRACNDRTCFLTYFAAGTDIATYATTSEFADDDFDPITNLKELGRDSYMFGLIGTEPPYDFNKRVYSPPFSKIGGNTWTFEVPEWTTYAWRNVGVVRNLTGSTTWTFTDGAVAECNPLP